MDRHCLRLAAAALFIAGLSGGCGAEGGAPTDRESIVIEQPDSGRQDSSRPKEGKLPDRFRK